MSIEKIIGWKYVHVASVQALRDPVALAIWLYASAREDGWELQEKEIREHFNLSPEEYYYGVSALVRLDLLDGAALKPYSEKTIASLSKEKEMA